MHMPFIRLFALESFICLSGATAGSVTKKSDSLLRPLDAGTSRPRGEAIPCSKGPAGQQDRPPSWLTSSFHRGRIDSMNGSPGAAGREEDVCLPSRV